MISVGRERVSPRDSCARACHHVGRTSQRLGKTALNRGPRHLGLRRLHYAELAGQTDHEQTEADKDESSIQGFAEFFLQDKAFHSLGSLKLDVAEEGAAAASGMECKGRRGAPRSLQPLGCFRLL